MGVAQLRLALLHPLATLPQYRQYTHTQFFTEKASTTILQQVAFNSDQSYLSPFPTSLPPPSLLSPSLPRVVPLLDCAFHCRQRAALSGSPESQPCQRVRYLYFCRENTMWPFQANRRNPPNSITIANTGAPPWPRAADDLGANYNLSALCVQFDGQTAPQVLCKQSTKCFHKAILYPLALYEVSSCILNC